MLIEPLEQRALLSVDAGLAPALQVVADQATYAGRTLSLPAMGSFTQRVLPGDFPYVIDWGDGSPAEQGHARIDAPGSALAPLRGSLGGSHQYPAPGVYPVTVSVTDPMGNADTERFCVSVWGPELDLARSSADNSSPPAGSAASEPLPFEEGPFEADAIPTNAVLLAAIRDELAIPAANPVTLADMQRLKTLHLDSNLVTTLSGLEEAVNLETLVIVPSDFSQTGQLTTLAPLNGLAHLKTLTLQKCGLTYSVLTTLPTLSALEELDLRYNNVSSVPSFSNLPALKKLSVHGNPLCDNPRPGLAAIAGKLINVDLPADHPEKALANIDPANPTATYSALAGAFYDLPIEIYEYVVNTIEFQPYQGQMKGPLAVLETGAGNDWDTDALLIELFEEANVNLNNLHYDVAQVVETVADAENILGAKNVQGACDLLYSAGLRPTPLAADGQTPVSPSDPNVTYIAFDRVWVAGTIAGQTVALDPIRKGRDYQDGLGNMLDVCSFDSTGYLSTTTKEIASEYYENQVRDYFADPAHPERNGRTIADVPYDGPIHAQVITALPSSPLSLYWDCTTPTSYNLNSVPAQYTFQAQITVAKPWAGNYTVTGSNYVPATNRTTITAGGTPAQTFFTAASVGTPLVIAMPDGDKSFLIKEYLSATSVKVEGNATCSGCQFATSIVSTAGANLLKLPDVSLKRLTVGYTGTTTTLIPHIYLNGLDAVTPPGTGVAADTELKIVVQVFPAYAGTAIDPAVTVPYAQVYSRRAGKYLAIGLDAHQTSPQRIAELRRALNEANISQLNDSNWIGGTQPNGVPNKDLLIGGLLQLAVTEYFHQCNEGEEIIGGLSEARPVYNAVASGIAGSDTAQLALDPVLQDRLQIAWLPQGMGIDVPGNYWDTMSIKGDYAQDAARELLAGYLNSSLEGAIWEELTNTPSLSTVTSLQLAHAHSITTPPTPITITRSSRPAMKRPSARTSTARIRSSPPIFITAGSASVTSFNSRRKDKTSGATAALSSSAIAWSTVSRNPWKTRTAGWCRRSFRLCHR